MTHRQQLCHGAEAKQNKTLLILGMLRIWGYNSLIVIECGFCFLKRDAVFLFVDCVFIFVPLKLQHTLAPLVAQIEKCALLAQIMLGQLGFAGVDLGGNARQVRHIECGAEGIGAYLKGNTALAADLGGKHGECGGHGETHFFADASMLFFKSLSMRKLTMVISAIMNTSIA